MFYCENCCNKHNLPCLNRHKYYNGVLCTCSCNWDKPENLIPTDFIDHIPIQVFITCTHGYCDILASKFTGNNFTIGKYKGANVIHKQLSFEAEGTMLSFDVAKDKIDSILGMIIDEPCVKKTRLFQVLKSK